MPDGHSADSVARCMELAALVGEAAQANSASSHRLCDAGAGSPRNGKLS